MAHIAKMMKWDGYSDKVRSKQRYDLHSAFFERTKPYFKDDYLYRNWGFPELPKESYSSREVMGADFKKMFNLFERWKEISKTGRRGISEFLWSLHEAERELGKYRKERKLNLCGHPKYFSPTDTWSYSLAPFRTFTYYHPSSSAPVRNPDKEHKGASAAHAKKGNEARAAADRADADRRRRDLELRQAREAEEARRGAERMRREQAERERQTAIAKQNNRIR